MVILELFRTGLIYMALCFSEPWVWIPACFCLLFGLAVQVALLKKCRKKWWRMSVLVIGLLGIAICECIWHLRTGWWKLMLTMVSLLAVSLLLGAVIAITVSFLKTKKYINSKCLK